MEIKTRRKTKQTLAQWFEEKGRQAVRQEASQGFAQRFSNKGMSWEDVAEVTVLSPAEVDKLISSN